MKVSIGRDCITINPFKNDEDLRCAPLKEIYKNKDEKNYYDKNLRIVTAAIESKPNSNDCQKKEEDDEKELKDDIMDYSNLSWEELLIRSMESPVIPFNWDKFKE